MDERGANTASELEQYIDRHKVACPECGHPLRGTTGARCPECGLRLALTVSRRHRVPAAWMTAVITATLGASFLPLTPRWIAFGSADMPWWKATLPFAPVGFAFIAIALLCIPGRFAKRARRHQWAIAASVSVLALTFWAGYWYGFLFW